ncbi:MAG: HAMP domain-containing protein [SAR324 cluster bacterium]|nr:HAMP domain-containing protein [SAR324 cluster bacterium]
MTIRLRSWLNASFIVIFCVFSLGLFSLSFEQSNKIIRHQGTMHQLTRGILELNLLSRDYLDNPVERAFQQWHQRYDSIILLIDTIEAGNEEERYLINSTRSSFEEVLRTFTELVEFERQPNSDHEHFSHSDRVKIMTSRLSIRALQLMSSIQHLSGVIQNRLLTRKNQIHNTLLISFMVGGGILIMVVIKFNRYLLKAITGFQQGVRIIGKGDLDHRIRLESHDELGNLANDFNQMTFQLRTVRESLQDEIQAHTVAEQRAEEYARQVVQKNEELSEYAFLIAHDIQEPIRSMTGFIQILQRRNESRMDEGSKELISRAVKAGERMKRLVNDLLKTASISSEDDSRFESFSVNELMKEITDEIKPLIEQHQAHIQQDLLPRISGNREQWRQLLLNLLDNAIKFRSDRSPEIRISAMFLESHEWQFSIADNGIGIHHEYMETVFQMFKRLHPRTRYEGSGVGLTIAKRIVVAHGGRIWAESRVGEGTTIFWTIPLTQVA